MGELDIWIKVLESIGYKFIDEWSGRGSNNYVLYEINNSGIKLYFNRENLNVTFVTDDKNSINRELEYDLNKESFYNYNIDKFREVKLKYLIK